MILEATRGTTYRIQVGGFGGDQGALVLSGESFVLPPPPPPPPPPSGPENDLFAHAEVIGALPFSDVQSTGAAGLEPGEPQPCGEIGATIWYRFTPKATTSLDVDTEGTAFDTVLAVYTGATVDALSLLACNDDTAGTVQSQISFQAAAGTTYWIQAGGFDGDHGELRVNAHDFG